MITYDIRVIIIIEIIDNYCHLNVHNHIQHDYKYID